jgi:hypothetical protein
MAPVTPSHASDGRPRLSRKTVVRSTIVGVLIFAVLFFALNIPFGILRALIVATIATCVVYGAMLANIYSAIANYQQLEYAGRQEQREIARAEEEAQRTVPNAKPLVSATAEWLQPSGTAQHRIALEISNAGPGVAKDIRLELHAGNGKIVSEDLGPIGPRQMVQKTVPIQLGQSWETTPETPGYGIMIHYRGDHGWGDGCASLVMSQLHPPKWRIYSGGTREPRIGADEQAPLQDTIVPGGSMSFTVTRPPM